ncbi:MAG: SAM-dependent methyltransferase [Acidimicrobiia bacterium]
MARHDTTTDALDRAEQEWWAAHGALEERFCWVQTPTVRRLLRRRYLAEVAAAVPPGGSVLEIGCGTGWLGRELAALGAGAVAGIDFSAEQVDRARVATLEAGLADKVRVDVARPVDLLDDGRRFDVVVVHAMLHHLSVAEIGDTLEAVAGLLVPGGRLAVFEPSMVPTDGPGATAPPALKALRRLERLPMSLHRRRLRPVGAAEAAARYELSTRHVGNGPFGPAPKEAPFVPGELPVLLGERFRVDSCAPRLALAHLVAQEALLAGLSQPRLWTAATPLLAAVARGLDQRVMARPPAGVWVFELYLCTRLADA